MFLGLIFAIGACFVWGLIFVIPQMLGDFSSLEVVLGRYLSYGILSAFLLFRKGLAQARSYPMKAWVAASIFALVSNLIYYLGLVMGLRFASPTLTVLVIGLAPITIAFYGNWKAREVAFRDLALPCLWIGFGLLLVNIKEVDWSFKAQSPAQYLLGLIGMGVALVAWSWYAVHNARFLKRNMDIPAGEWSTLMGVATLFWAILLGIIFSFATQEVNISRMVGFSEDSLRYLLGSSVLGIACSWLGCYLWSQASVHLPVSLMGPLLIFEMLFGLIFVYLFQWQFPSWLELIGVSFMVAGIMTSIYIFRKKQLINN